MPQEENSQAKPLESGVFSAQMLYGKKIDLPPIVEEKKVETEQAKKVEENTIKTPLGDVKIEKPTEVTENIFAEFGFKSKEELTERLNKLKELEENEKLIKDNVRNKQIVELVGKMPPDIRSIVNAWDNGEDYHNVAKAMFVEGIDLSKKASDIDEFKLIAHYNPDVTQADWEDMDDKPKEVLLKASKRAFESDAQHYAQLNRQSDTKHQEYADKVVASVTKTMEQLSKDFPNLDNKQKREIEVRLLENPVADIITQDGLYTDDAASKLAWQLYGKQTNEQIVKAMQDKVYGEIEKGVKQRASEELELMAKAKGDGVTKLADGKDTNLDEITKARQSVASFLYDPSSQFVNKTERKP